MFDSILDDIVARFGIRLDQAKQLLGMLIAVIYNEKRGGPAGFVDLLRSRGLGDRVDSWIGQGPNLPLAPGQLENTLGAGLISAIAQRAGLDAGTTGNALSAMLPDVFNGLSEDGRIPAPTLPERLRGYVADIGDWFRDLGGFAVAAGAAAIGAVGTAAAATGRAVGNVAEGAADAVGDAARATGRAVGNVAEGTVDAVGDAARATGRAVDRGVDKLAAGVDKLDGRRDGKMGLLPWIIIGALLLGGLFWWKGCDKQEAAPVETTPAAATPAEPAAPAVPAANSTFSFENTDGSKVTVNGAVASDAEKIRLWDALKATFGDGNVNGDIVVNPNTAPAGWMDKLIAMLPDLKAKGLKFGFDGDKLNLDTSAMSEADRIALSDKFRGAFSGYEISGMWDKAMAALSSLKDGFTGDELVKALDLSNIYFDTGKATITRDSLETLTKAAEYIKKAPAGTKIEISGHTDNTGDAAANMTLSQQRADAVVAKLQELGVGAGILTAKGYGQDKPVADNGTEEGRAQNRRIDYAISK